MPLMSLDQIAAEILYGFTKSLWPHKAHKIKKLPLRLIFEGTKKVCPLTKPPSLQKKKILL